MPNKFFRYLIGFVFLCSTPSVVEGALITGADSSGGYSATVLEMVLKNYIQPSFEVQGHTTVLVRIAKDGRPFSCELRTASSSPQADDAICQAVAAALQFPAPPQNAASAEVALTFVYNNTFSQGNLGEGVAPVGIPLIPPVVKELTLAEEIMANVTKSLEIPPTITSGTYELVIMLMISSTGNIMGYKIEKPTGNSELDMLVLRAITEPGIVPVPKNGLDEEVTLNFNLKF